MKIAYLGNTRFHQCTESHISKTLELLGHKVIKLQEDTVDLETVIKEANNSDMFLWTRTPGWLKFDGQEMLDRINVLTVSYHLDLYCGISREGSIVNDPWWTTNYVFQVDGAPKSMKFFKDHNINAYWMPPAVYASECYLANQRDDFKHDVVFVGSYHYHPEWNYRPKLIDWLKNTYGNKFKHYSYTHDIWGNDLNQLMATAKVVVADTLCMDFKHPNYWSNRVVEVTGRGGFVIHPNVPGLDKFYKDKKHLVYYEYGNFNQLKELIDYYIVHEDERNKIRLAGHEYTKNNHTFTHRLKECFRIIKEEGQFEYLNA